MTQYLPPNLLALFAPRDPIRFLPPLDKLCFEKKTDGYNGVADFLSDFEDPKDTPPPTRGETRAEKIIRKRREKEERAKLRVQTDIQDWDPHANEDVTTDAFKTLFVSRINFDTSESKLRREFEYYGPIKMIHMVHCKKTGKPKGYAFIEYQHERDMHAAFKSADGKKIDGRRVLVDVERARTVKGWVPRRLGGGLGGTRRGGPDQNTRHSGREDPSGSRGDDDRDRDIRRGGGERDDRRRRRSRSRSRSRERERERSRRERERERERERTRREREKTDRRDRDRDRDRDRRRRDRSRDRDRDRRDRDGEDRKPTAEELAEYEAKVKIKQEPMDDYPTAPPVTEEEGEYPKAADIKQEPNNGYGDQQPEEGEYYEQ